MRNSTSLKCNRKTILLGVIFVLIVRSNIVRVYWESYEMHKTSYRSNGEDITPLFREKKLVIWNNDHHPAPVVDAKRLLEPLGVDVMMHVLSDYCIHFDVCDGRRHLKVIDKFNYVTLNQPMVDAFYESYKDDRTMESVDAFLCYDPAFICELFEPFNRSIILIFTGRYYFGRVHTGQTLTAWNMKLSRLAASRQHFIGANNLYDVNVVRYYTGIEPTYVPNYCDYTGATYNPVRRGYLLAKRRPDVAFLDWFEDVYVRAAANATRAEVRRLIRIDRNYTAHTYLDLASHRGIVHLPYQVSTMSVVEQYRMNVPLFFPSQPLLFRWNRERRVLLERLRMRVPIKPHHTQRHLPDPRDDRSAKAMSYWIKFADYYTMPHIVYFDSIEHLVELLERLTTDDLLVISEKMKQYNADVKDSLRRKWTRILQNVAKFSSNKPR